ncbi:putative fungal specific transcription factor [Lyophyllum shimeji]|uniref:Fungal specific transcription factor n=1 Tax=Lyophyllum shimeji TaxID=47721 RepID=A0A9P3PS19_LYOSH|nr:putative fungal specific transcription factor [Lyophyllum shimeji]
MPAVKTNSTTKRGAPKAKGAIRAKSGCYTCRIRRKKCDEQQDASGRCTTCVRLRLECLGFGAKRPEWLRESRNVAELREKIKAFLAAQGMIKGHSGSGSRGSEHEQPTLRLAEECSDSSASPPTPTLSLSSDPVCHHHNLSSIRDDPTSSWSMGQSGYGHSPSLYPSSIRDTSPFSSQGSTQEQTSYQIVPSDPTRLSPANFSSFSALYTFQFAPEDYGILENPEDTVPRDPPPHMMEVIDQMVQHYKERVVSVQYLFADDPVRTLICETVSSHSRTRDAASLLASVHWQRFLHPDRIAFQSEETQSRLRDLMFLLDAHDVGSGDAMAALHIVSSYLFDGGSGQWEPWLLISYQYVDNLFRKYGGPSEALLQCSAKDAFIIKTSIWFDVLASVTTQKSPHFLHAVRTMFAPNQARIWEVSSDDRSSMMSPMGCHNQVVWALAETSHLSYWKMQQLRSGCLSNPTLVKRGMDIDDVLAPPSEDIAYATSDIHGCRVLASEIFRASARLYLRAVISGDHPYVPEIRESVQDTIDCVSRLSYPTAQTVVNGQRMSRSVVRNTVFSFFICGAFAEKREHRAFIEDMLDREGDGAGNCGSIRVLLRQLWETRDSSRRASHSKAFSDAVPWRNMLWQAKLLLV